MKILVVSDSHGNDEILDKILLEHPDMDLYLHAGDSQSSPYQISPFKTVKGNCDHFYDMDERLQFDTPYGKILMQHYPNISMSLLKKLGIKIFIHGHTHKRRQESLDGILFLNPGSVSSERDSYGESYLILEITKDDVKIEFKTI